jgi:hypothetical protein
MGISLETLPSTKKLSLPQKPREAEKMLAVSTAGMSSIHKPESGRGGWLMTMQPSAGSPQYEEAMVSEMVELAASAILAVNPECQSPERIARAVM